jgi:hypothetical protein
MSTPRTQRGGGEQHSLAGEVVGGPNADDRTEILVLCILCEIKKQHYVEETKAKIVFKYLTDSEVNFEHYVNTVVNVHIKEYRFLKANNI